MTAIFYGVSPAVIALIVHFGYRLAKLGMADWLQWGIAAVATSQRSGGKPKWRCCSKGRLFSAFFMQLVVSRRQLADFAARRRPGAHQHRKGADPIRAEPLARAFSEDSLTFGSGLIIVLFLEKDLAQQTGWLNGREFLIAVAVVMLSPGLALITAIVVGFLVAGFWGSLVSTIEIFLPSLFLIVAVAPILVRHRANPNVQGFVKGAYAPAIGTIVGVCVPPGQIAGDWLTALIAPDGLAVLFRWRVSSPRLIAATAVIGLTAFPIRQPTLVLVK